MKYLRFLLHPIVLACIGLILVVYLWVGCSGGGGGGSDSEEPEIKSMSFLKDGFESVLFEIGDEVQFLVIAVDSDKDMEQLIIEQYLYPDLDAPYYEGEFVLPDQTAKRMEYFSLEKFLVDGPVGHWRICAYIVDSEGKESSDFCVNTVTQ